MAQWFRVIALGDDHKPENPHNRFGTRRILDGLICLEYFCTTSIELTYFFSCSSCCNFGVMNPKIQGQKSADQSCMQPPNADRNHIFKFHHFWILQCRAPVTKTVKNQVCYWQRKAAETQQVWFSSRERVTWLLLLQIPLTICGICRRSRLCLLNGSLILLCSSQQAALLIEKDRQTWHHGYSFAVYFFSDSPRSVLLTFFIES